MIRLLALLAPFLLAACAVGPDYARPRPLPPEQVRLQEAIENGRITATPLPPQWWRLFDDPELDRLVAAALTHNTDLRQSAASLQRARALLSEARSDSLPTTDLSAQYRRQRVGASSQTSTGAGGVGTGTGTSSGSGPDSFTFDYFSAGLDASYALDLFGGVSRSIEAARADYQSAQAAVDAGRVSVVAETANTYALACGYALQADVARETERLQARTLDLTQRRLAAGSGTLAEVAQAQVLVEQAHAQVPLFEAEHRASLYALAVLTGAPPALITGTAAARCRVVPATKLALPIGDGQALLARRPDVRQAERQLAADTARVGVATADLYPSITLLGSVSLGATRLGDVGKSRSFGYSLGPLISWNFPLNGAARARVRENEAIANGSLARFDGTVLTALRETEQALARASGAADREAALARAVTASGTAARISQLRFDYGSDDFLQLLDTQRQRATARAQLASAQLDRAQAQVAIFRALGGGWEDAPPVETNANRNAAAVAP